MIINSILNLYLIPLYQADVSKICEARILVKVSSILVKVSSFGVIYIRKIVLYHPYNILNNPGGSEFPHAFLYVAITT